MPSAFWRPPTPASPGGKGRGFDQALAIRIVVEDGLAAVAAIHDVIVAPGYSILSLQAVKRETRPLLLISKIHPCTCPIKHPASQDTFASYSLALKNSCASLGARGGKI